nr:putative ribonuclease H-like domain-containing protein [Tanacetum cinerariifolium]
MCTEFEKMMRKKFQMSSMGELAFFLGLQVTQKDDRIFISQDKYVDEILMKFGFLTMKIASTPIETSKPLLKDTEAEDVDVHLYRSMIGSLMYLIASSPDIMFVKPTESEGFEQTVDFLNANPIKYALTVNPTIYTSCIKQFWAMAKVKIVNGEEQIQALVGKKKVIIIETSVRSDLHLEDSKYIFDHMVKNLEDEHVTTTSNDPLLNSEDRLKLTELMEPCTQLQSRVLALETTKANQALEIRSLKRKVKKLEKKANKKTHKLKRLYKIGSSTKVESSEDAGLGDQEDASKHERIIDDLDADAEVTLEISTVDPVTTDGEVVTTVGVEVSTAAITPQISMDEITLAKALIDIKTSKPKAKGIVMQEPSETPTLTPIVSTQQPSKAKDKGKAKMIEAEKPLKKKDQIMFDEEKLDEQVEAEVDDDQEEAEMKMYIKTIPDDEIAIDAIPLATKPPIIVD